MLLARLESSKGNTIRPRALAVDAAGTIYVGGMSASGAPVSEGAFGGQFEGGGAFFCILSVFLRIFNKTGKIAPTIVTSRKNS